MLKNSFFAVGFIKSTRPPLSTSVINNSESFFSANKFYHSALVRFFLSCDLYCKKFEKFVVVKNQLCCPSMHFCFQVGEKSFFFWQVKYLPRFRFLFLVNSTTSLFNSIMLRFGVDVYFSPFIKINFLFLERE